MTFPSLPGPPVPDLSDRAPDLPADRELVRRGADAELLTARLVSARRPGQWIGAAVVLVLFAMLVHTLVTNGRFQWGVVGGDLITKSVLNPPTTF